MTEVFHMVPATSRTWWTFVPIAVVLIIVLFGTGALVVASVRGSQRASFELSPAGLRLRGDVYGRLIPASELRGGAARVVDLQHERTLQPRSRTMGTAIPGYRAGWFRLANGNKALLYLTDHHRVVYVPTRAGYSLLLSVDRPAEFVERLRTIAPAA